MLVLIIAMQGIKQASTKKTAGPYYAQFIIDINSYITGTMDFSQFITKGNEWIESVEVANVFSRTNVVSLWDYLWENSQTTPTTNKWVVIDRDNDGTLEGYGFEGGSQGFNCMSNHPDYIGKVPFGGRACKIGSIGWICITNRESALCLKYSPTSQYAQQAVLTPYNTEPYASNNQEVYIYQGTPPGYIVKFRTNKIDGWSWEMSTNPKIWVAVDSNGDGVLEGFERSASTKSATCTDSGAGYIMIGKTHDDHNICYGGSCNGNNCIYIEAQNYNLVYYLTSTLAVTTTDPTEPYAENGQEVYN